jgi:5-methyltetrahydrofolate--homocysteine methyltransferase
LSWLKGMMDKEPPEPENPIGVIVIGNLEGDRVHQNSKDMVRKSLKKAQFKTIDIGKNVSAEMFASKAKEYNADIIAVSINTSMAKDNLNKLLPAIEAAGLKDKVTVMVGGVAVDEDDAEEVGVLYGDTREEAVALAKQAIKKLKDTNE